MNHICYTCKKETKGWVKVSPYSCDQFNTYCSYDCYKKNPMIVPTQSECKSRALESLESEPVLFPHMNNSKDDEFIFLTETEINQLTNDQYRNYKDDLEQSLNENNDIYQTTLENEKREKELEDEFNESSSNDENDDY